MSLVARIFSDLCNRIAGALAFNMSIILVFAYFYHQGHIELGILLSLIGLVIDFAVFFIKRDELFTCITEHRDNIGYMIVIAIVISTVGWIVIYLIVNKNSTEATATAIAQEATQAIAEITATAIAQEATDTFNTQAAETEDVQNTATAKAHATETAEAQETHDAAIKTKTISDITATAIVQMLTDIARTQTAEAEATIKAATANAQSTATASVVAMTATKIAEIAETADAVGTTITGMTQTAIAQSATDTAIANQTGTAKAKLTATQSAIDTEIAQTPEATLMYQNPSQGAVFRSSPDMDGTQYAPMNYKGNQYYVHKGLSYPIYDYYEDRNGDIWYYIEDIHYASFKYPPPNSRISGAFGWVRADYGTVITLNETTLTLGTDLYLLSTITPTFMPTYMPLIEAIQPTDIPVENPTPIVVSCSNPRYSGSDPCNDDEDGDNVFDWDDHCPNNAGSHDNNGCPADNTVVTPTVCDGGLPPVYAGNNPCNYDEDGDTVSDENDKCPFTSGDPSFQGCQPLTCKGEGKLDVTVSGGLAPYVTNFTVTHPGSDPVSVSGNPDGDPNWDPPKSGRNDVSGTVTDSIGNAVSCGEWDW